MIQVTALVQKEDISEAEEEKHGTHAIEQTQQNEKTQHSQQREVNRHSVAGPGMHPFKSVVGE